MKSIDALEMRITAQQEKLAQLKAQKARIEAQRKAAESKAARAAKTRRKILVGAVILSRVERGEWPLEKLQNLMNDALTRDDDRALFNLNPLPLAQSNLSHEQQRIES